MILRLFRRMTMYIGLIDVPIWRWCLGFVAESCAVDWSGTTRKISINLLTRAMDYIIREAAVMGARYEYLFKRSIILHCVKRFSFVTFLSKGLVSIICGQFYSCVFIGLVLMINGLFNSGEEKKTIAISLLSTILTWWKHNGIIARTKYEIYFSMSFYITQWHNRGHLYTILNAGYFQAAMNRTHNIITVYLRNSEHISGVIYTSSMAAR